MTEKHNPNEKFFYRFTYEGEYRDYELSRLCFYLQGKPDYQSWRNAFAGKNFAPIPHKGRIYPDWAIEDARILYQEDPQTMIRMLAQYSLSLEDIPPLG